MSPLLDDLVDSLIGRLVVGEVNASSLTLGFETGWFGVAVAVARMPHKRKGRSAQCIVLVCGVIPCFCSL